MVSRFKKKQQYIINILNLFTKELPIQDKGELQLKPFKANKENSQ